MFNKISDLTLCAFFTAFTAITAQIQIMTPFGIPVTLQTFGIALCGYFLGAKLGTVSTVTYILLGAVGLPIFSGLGSGTGVLLGATGGFIFGFLPFAVLCGAGLHSKTKIYGILLGTAGLIICHIMGVIQYKLISGGSVFSVFAAVSLPFILKDIILTVCAYFTALRLKKALIRG